MSNFDLFFFPSKTKTKKKVWDTLPAKTQLLASKEPRLILQQTANSTRPKFEWGGWKLKLENFAVFPEQGPGSQAPGTRKMHPAEKQKSGWYILEIDTMDTQNRLVMEKVCP